MPRRDRSHHSPSATPSITLSTQPTSPVTERRRVWLFRLLVGATIAIVYANALNATFVFDDLEYVDRPGSSTLWPPNWLRASRPLLRLSLAINHQFAALDEQGKSDPRGYHALNIAIHLATALALFALLRRMLRLPRAGQWSPREADCLALATVLLWCVHPLTTQAVTYVVQRCESLAALGMVLYLYGLLRSAQSPTPASRAVWGCAAIVACVLGLASKETAIAVIPLGVLFDRVLLDTSWRELLTRRGWLHGVLIAIATLGAVKILPELLRAGTNKTAGFNIGTYTWWEYVRSQPAVVLQYLRLAVWPDRLCLDYFWPAATVEQSIVPGLIVVAALLLSVYLLWKSPAWGVLAVAFWLLLAPSCGAVAMQDLVMEHRFYAPLALVILAVVIGAWRGISRIAGGCGWSPRQRVAIAAVGCVILVVALGARTVARNENYGTQIDLWEVDQHVAPHNPRLQATLGNLYWQQGERKRALQHYRTALQLAPGTIAETAYAYEMNWVAATICRELGRGDEAIEHLQAALAGARADEEQLAVGLELATGLDVLDRSAEAEKILLRLAALKQDSARLRWTYAQFLEQHGRTAEAREQWRRAVALAPDDEQLQSQYRQRFGP